jgi:histidine ammonia-lyase
MATGAAARLAPMAGHVAAIAAIELLAAAQGVDLRRPLVTSPVLAGAHARIRGAARFWDRDRPFAADLAAVRAQVERGDYLDDVPEVAVAG